jgi:hypothetical protein
MVDSRTFDGQIQLVEYVPRVLHGQARHVLSIRPQVIGPQTIMATPPTRRDDTGRSGGAMTWPRRAGRYAE